MRNILFILLLLLSMSAFATHERAGEITYKYLGGYTYEITVTTYTRLESYQADRCTITIHFGDGDSTEVCRSNYEPGDPTSDAWGATCTANPACTTHHLGEWSNLVPCIHSKKNVYTTTHTYAGPWAYVISFTDPNRVGNIINVTDLSALSLSDTLIINPFIAGNSSPVFSNLSVDTAHLFICHSYNPGATDPDGDSLSYELIPCEDSPGHAIAGYFIPAGVSLNTTSGVLTWCNPPPITLGPPYTAPYTYNFAMKIKEWRKLGDTYIKIGTVMRDIQILVETCALMSVNDLENNLSAIAISPNPCSSSTTLSTDKFFKNTTLALYNTFGQQVKQINNISGQQIILQRENLPSGIYFIRMTENNHILATDKLIITD